jgi:hypothetical protein
MIIIGQAAEFDYAGTQACKAIKEEGLEAGIERRRRSQTPGGLIAAGICSRISPGVN